MHVILTTKSSLTNKGGIRVPTIEGETSALPNKGYVFIMIGPSLNGSGGIRYIKTTQVQSVEKIRPDLYEFSTRNTVYSLQILKDPVPVEEI